jgi:DNA-directed RNA polymerase subunit RPC12/RpoP
VSGILDCGEHGKRPWQGHVVCAQCGAMYQTSDAEGAYYAPILCEGCGVRLMPFGRPHNRKEFSARSICAECFAKGRALP